VTHANVGAKPVLTLPEELAGGWRADGMPLSSWVPAYHNPSASASRTYRAGDVAVAVWAGLYRHQGSERKMVTSSNRLVDGESTVWSQLLQRVRSVNLGLETQVMRSVLLRSPADPNSMPVQRLNVLYCYRVGGRLTVSDARAKIELALARLLGRGDDSAVIFFYAATDGDNEQSRRHLDAFVGQHVATIAAAVDRAIAEP
jgi:EpsI family protein